MTDNRHLELILGGARSGKSRLAQSRAAAHGTDVVYIATAEARDNEVRERIEHHRRDRPAHWRTVEAPLHLADAVGAAAAPGTTVLVDCLTLWLTNLLCHEDAALFETERDALLACLDGVHGNVLLVSNETGQGVVPADPLSRRFVDEAGRLHQALAQQCDTVLYCVAGLPQVLKDVR
jgi:adenosylcobinamide kinase/adenosylcobinamide-phosphate guanylyltransferase